MCTKSIKTLPSLFLFTYLLFYAFYVLSVLFVLFVHVKSFYKKKTKKFKTVLITSYTLLLLCLFYVCLFLFVLVESVREKIKCLDGLIYITTKKFTLTFIILLHFITLFNVHYHYHYHHHHYYHYHSHYHHHSHIFITIFFNYHN